MYKEFRDRFIKTKDINKKLMIWACTKIYSMKAFPEFIIPDSLIWGLGF